MLQLSRSLNSRRTRLAAALLLTALLITEAGCSVLRRSTPEADGRASKDAGSVEVVSRGTLLFEGPVEQLYPCNDGDVAAYRVEGGPRSGEIMVSRMFALKKPGDFRITNSYKGELAEALHLRVDDDQILVISQIDADQDVGITFAEPLPLVSVPLHAGVTSFRSAVRIWRPSSGRTMGDGEVTLTLSVNEDTIAGYERTFAATQSGTFQLMRQSFDVQSTAWLFPGLGEVLARRMQAGTETETYALVCARIKGNEVVDCNAVASALDE